MKQSINIKLSQGLKLTPQLQQSIKLLQLSVVELNAEIQEMLDSNPLLEEEPVKIEASHSEQEQQAELNTENQEKEQNWQEQFETRQSSSNITSNVASEDYDVYATSSSQQSLEDKLVWQVQMSKLSERDKLIAEAIIFSLNPDGYLLLSNQEIVDILPPEMTYECDEIAATIKLIQTFEPAGIASRNLQERLLFILLSKEQKHPEMAHDVNHYLAKCIAKNHLQELADRNLVSLKNKLDIDQEQLVDAIQYIQTINPHIDNSDDQNDNLYICLLYTSPSPRDRG